MLKKLNYWLYGAYSTRSIDDAYWQTIFVVPGLLLINIQSVMLLVCPDFILKNIEKGKFFILISYGFIAVLNYFFVYYRKNFKIEIEGICANWNIRYSYRKFGIVYMVVSILFFILCIVIAAII